MITKADAMTLRTGQILHHITAKDSRGEPVRARINGKCQTWKTRPDEFRLPMKHGLKDTFQITPANCHEWVKPN